MYVVDTKTTLSRISRSLLHLLEVVREFETQGIELISLRENIDMSTTTGQGFLAIMSVIAQIEKR
jgi:DNA invertase Pin-like site-specific DNA recombinase